MTQKANNKNCHQACARITHWKPGNDYNLEKGCKKENKNILKMAKKKLFKERKDRRRNIRPLQEN